MRTYNYDETLAMLRKFVELKGEDFVYYGDPDDHNNTACYYAKDEQPDCVVGHVLVEVGVPVKELGFIDGQRNGNYASGFAEEVLGAVERDGIAGFDNKATRLLSSVQKRQDDRIPWGESLEGAVRYVNNTD